MIIVLDTNVIISALLSPSGPSAEIINHWEADQFEVVTSSPLLSELERALQYPRVKKYLKRSSDEVAAFIKRLKRVATVVRPQLTLEVIQEDPVDNRVLECAVAGGASYIVTGNDHLVKIKKYKEIVILKPAESLALIILG
jgi:putative PIN family toxin of toxin-antitoxin system